MNLSFALDDVIDEVNLTCNGYKILLPEWVVRWKIRQSASDFVYVAMVGATRSAVGTLVCYDDGVAEPFYHVPEEYWTKKHTRSDNGQEEKEEE